MTTSTSSTVIAVNTDSTGKWLLPHIAHGLEGLWLVAAFLVPLIFLGQEYALSEAKIAYIEVPKVALLRTLAALIAMIWSIEWAISSNPINQGVLSITLKNRLAKARPDQAFLALKNWLTVHPTRWFILAAGLFFGFTFLSTVLSGSFTTSMWGEIPGQDGYSAYSTASWGIIFAVIATHLRSQAQLSRLLGAVVLMGILVGFYGTMQHYGHDFLSTTESTGGGSERVTIFMGNAIFAGAVLAMTVPVTLVAAAMSLHVEDWEGWGPFLRLTQLGRDTVVATLWAVMITVQLLGLMFTFSRGPWSGAILAIVAFLVLVLLSFGWRSLIRNGLVMGLAGVYSVAFLHWQGSVSILNVGPWLGIVLAILGFAGSPAILFIIKRFSRTIVFIAIVGAAATAIGAAVIAPSALSDRGNAGSSDGGVRANVTTEQVTARITSIKTEVLGGFTGGRGTHWRVSWGLIRDRPWFEFDDLNLYWLRPFIGYGPDLFRYTYLLRSPVEGPHSPPLEPDQAHNYFIHQTVEQGIFGGFASLAIFISTFGIVGHQIIRKRLGGSPVNRLLLIGMMAVILGRFLEMMVGVARVSDLTILWIIFGLFAASLNFDDEMPGRADTSASPPPKRENRRSRRRSRKQSTPHTIGSGLVFRLAIVAWLIGVIGVVSWQKNINYVRASVAEGQAIRHFNERDFESTIEALDKAIRLGPGIPTYHQNRAETFLAYYRRPELFTHPGCSQQTDLSYLVCLGMQSLESNLEGAKQQPFNYRAQISVGNSAFNLQLWDIEIDAYRNASLMVPNAFPIRNQYAALLIEAGRYDEALVELDESLKLTQESGASAQALFLKGQSLKELGRFDEASKTFIHGVLLAPTSGTVSASLAMLSELNTEIGVDLDAMFFSRAILENPQDSVSLYFRGLVHLATGNAVQALLDLRESYDLGLVATEVVGNIGYARLHTGYDPSEIGEFQQAAALSPQVAMYHVFWSESELLQGNYAKALSHLDIARDLNPNLGLAYVIRARLFMSIGMAESARNAIDSSRAFGLSYAQAYVDRGEVWAALGERGLALADFDEAIRLNPSNGSFYNARARAYASMGDLESALADFDAAIERESSNAGYFINRGVAYGITEESDRSSSDFKTALALGATVVPLPEDRDRSFFVVYKSVPPSEVNPLLFLKFQTEASALNQIDLNLMVKDHSPDFPYALQVLAETYMGLGLWEDAVYFLSKLIEISPSTPEAYSERGNSYLALGRYQDAMEDYILATRLNPNNARTIVAKARGYAGIKEFVKAQAEYEKAIRLEPETADAYRYRGLLSVQLGDYQLALLDLNRAIEISPLDHESYSYRSQAHSGLDGTFLALKDLDQAIQIAPLNTDYLYDRGLISFNDGDYATAKEYFDRAITMESSIGIKAPEPYIGRAKVFLKLGNPNRAVEDGYYALEILRDYRSSRWDFQRATIDLKRADAHQLLGDSLTELGLLTAAKHEYENASKLR